MWFTEGLADLLFQAPKNMKNIRGLLDWWIGFVLMYAASGVLLTGAHIGLLNFLSDWKRKKRPDGEKKALNLRPIEILFYLTLLPFMVIGGTLLNIYVYQPALNP